MLNTSRLAAPPSIDDLVLTDLTGCHRTLRRWFSFSATDLCSLARSAPAVDMFDIRILGNVRDPSTKEWITVARRSHSNARDLGIYLFTVTDLALLAKALQHIDALSEARSMVKDQQSIPVAFNESDVAQAVMTRAQSFLHIMTQQANWMGLTETRRAEIAAESASDVPSHLLRRRFSWPGNHSAVFDAAQGAIVERYQLEFDRMRQAFQDTRVSVALHTSGPDQAPFIEMTVPAQTKPNEDRLLAQTTGSHDKHDGFIHLPVRGGTVRLKLDQLQHARGALMVE